MDPWTSELIVVRHAGMTGGERAAVSRDAARGLFHRLRQGVFVERAVWDHGEGWVRERSRHLLLMRALDAVSPFRPRFSHWSACVAKALPIFGRHLDRVHITVEDERLRGIDSVAAHLFRLEPEEVTEVGGLLVTRPARTVVDVAGASPFRGGVMVADGALHRGLPREALDAALDTAGPRKAQRRILDVIRFANPDAETPAESELRVSEYELGIAPQVLQHEVRLDGRFVARVDSYDERRQIVTEADGDVKYLDAAMAPAGAGRVVIKEKRREDLLRSAVHGLARCSSAEAGNPSLLRPILRRVGLLPEQHRPALSDWAAYALKADRNFATRVRRS